MHSELQLILIDDDAVIRVLNQHAADKFKVVSKAYEESFQSFLNALDESRDARVHFEEPNSDLTMAYIPIGGFFNLSKLDVP
jgi:hypothetical protein